MFLLTSLGGAAIIAAPVLLPALWWASNSAGAWARAGFAFLAALVATEVGWFIAFSAIGEQQPYIALGPALGFVGTLVFFSLTRVRRRGGTAGVSGSASAR